MEIPILKRSTDLLFERLTLVPLVLQVFKEMNLKMGDDRRSSEVSSKSPTVGCGRFDTRFIYGVLLLSYIPQKEI